MKAIKVMATVNQQGSLSLDKPLNIIQNSRVEVIILIPEAVEINEDHEQISSKEVKKGFKDEIALLALSVP